MNHCWTPSLPSSTYFYWMQGSPESQVSTLKLVFVPWLQSMIFFFFFPFFFPSPTAVLVSLLFQQGIIGLLLCLLLPQRKARSSGHSSHSANCLLIWQMYFKVEWREPTPLCVRMRRWHIRTFSVYIYECTSLFYPWPLQMQGKLWRSTDS